MTSFAALHHTGTPFLLPNAWDNASAAALARLGFPAIGTTSLGVAAAAGLPDGTAATKGETLLLARRLGKGPFVGRDALRASQDARQDGPTTRLRTVVIGGPEYLPIYGGEAVHAGGSVVGRVRSCAYGFTVRKNLAYSYLPVEMKPGEQVQVEVFGKLVPATVTTDAVISRQVPTR